MYSIYNLSNYIYLPTTHLYLSIYYPLSFISLLLLMCAEEFCGNSCNSSQVVGEVWINQPQMKALWFREIWMEKEGPEKGHGAS